MDKGTVEKMQSLASRKGGSFVSKTFLTAKDSYEWRCSEGHEWRAAGRAVQQGTWCPHCRIGRGEEMTRKALETILGYPLPRAYPIWLRRKGSRMELDGYSEENKIAFEYDGKQHFQKDHKFFENNPDEFKAQKERDRRKDDLCKQHGVTLIRIREHQRLTEEHVLAKCRYAVVRHGIMTKNNRSKTDTKTNTTRTKKAA